jgi:hypothetical protein
VRSSCLGCLAATSSQSLPWQPARFASTALARLQPARLHAASVHAPLPACPQAKAESLVRQSAAAGANIVLLQARAPSSTRCSPRPPPQLARLAGTCSSWKPTGQVARVFWSASLAAAAAAAAPAPGCCKGNEGAAAAQLPGGRPRPAAARPAAGAVCHALLLPGPGPQVLRAGANLRGQPGAGQVRRRGMCQWRDGTQHIQAAGRLGAAGCACISAHASPLC